MNKIFINLALVIMIANGCVGGADLAASIPRHTAALIDYQFCEHQANPSDRNAECSANEVDDTGIYAAFNIERSDYPWAVSVDSRGLNQLPLDAGEVEILELANADLLEHLGVSSTELQPTTRALLAKDSDQPTARVYSIKTFYQRFVDGLRVFGQNGVITRNKDGAVRTVMLRRTAGEPANATDWSSSEAAAATAAATVGDERAPVVENGWIFEGGQLTPAVELAYYSLNGYGERSMRIRDLYVRGENLRLLHETHPEEE